MKRAISGVVLVILGLLVFIPGGIVTWAAMLLLSMIGLFELYRAFDVHKKALAFVGYISAIVYFVLLLFGLTQFMFPWLVGTFSLSFMFYIFGYEKYTIEQPFAVVTGVVYVPYMMSYLYQTRMLEHGQWLVWVIFVAVFGCDIMAYQVGRAIGKHKMAPVLSPKKTIEGAVGGVVGSLVFGAIYGVALMKLAPEVSNPILLCMIACVFGSFFGMCGDLIASAIKRQKGIKDYGTLIPGHGGVLDRFDSVLIAGPIIYFAFYYGSQFMK